MGKQAGTLRVGYRYRAERVDGHYDAIVIGSGPGGLSTAACLSRMGKKVAVLEQHCTSGGFTHAYCRNGYEWEVGVHFLNDVADPEQFFGKLFNFLSGGRLKWSIPGEDRICLDVGDRPRMALAWLG